MAFSSSQPKAKTKAAAAAASGGKAQQDGKGGKAPQEGFVNDFVECLLDKEELGMGMQVHVPWLSPHITSFSPHAP